MFCWIFFPLNLRHMLLLPWLHQLFTSGQTRTLVAVQQYLIFNEQFPSDVSLCLCLLLTSPCHSASNLLAVCVSSYYISRAADSLMATLCVCVCVCVCVRNRLMLSITSLLGRKLSHVLSRAVTVTRLHDSPYAHRKFINSQLFKLE